MINIDYEYNDVVSWYRPENLIPFHPNFDQDRFKEILNSMKELGWAGRPILGLRGFKYGPVVCLTGAHRIYAAKELGIEVPVYILDTDILDPQVLADAIERFDKQGAEFMREEPNNLYE